MSESRVDGGRTDDPSARCDRERRSEREPPVMIEREHSSTPGEVKGILL